MPPKPRKQPEKLGGGELATLDEDSEYSVSSPLSEASTASVGHNIVMTSDQFHEMIAALRVTPPSAHAPRSIPAVSLTPKVTPIPVPKWAGEETPWEYFSKYEQAQKHNAIPREQWGPLLQVYITGKAQAAYAQVDPGKLDDFDLVKQTMLRSLGDTPAEADRQWWTLRRKKSETIGAFYLRLRTTANRRFYGVTTVEQMFDLVLLSRFMSLLPPDSYSSVSARHPETAEQAAEMTQDFESRRDFSRTYLAGDTSSGQTNPRNSFYMREQGGGGVHQLCTE